MKGPPPALAALSLCLLLGSGARAAAPADPAAQLRAALLQAASSLDGLEANKVWLQRLPFKLAPLSKRMFAHYEPPRAAEELGEIQVNLDMIQPSLKALSAMGVGEADATVLLAWCILPTVIHETQHAVQVAEYRRRGALEVYFIESEIEAGAVGTVVYLQVLDKRPDMARFYLPLKGENTSDLETWGAGFGPFREAIVKAYASPLPVPSLAEARARFADQAAATEETIQELTQERLRAKDAQDRAALTRLIDGSRDALRELRDPRIIEATVGYIREQGEHAEALWSQWAKTDPRRRLESEAGLPPRERARLAMRVAEQLELASPTANAGKIEQYYAQARSDAVQARDGGLVARIGRRQVAAEGRRLDYALDVVRGRAAATDDQTLLRQILQLNVEHLRPHLWPQHMRLIEEEARAALKK